MDTKGATVADTTARGEITSAVPVEHGVIAAAGNQLVRVDGKGKAAELAATEQPPYGIRIMRDGSVGCLNRSGATTSASAPTRTGK
ncbi:hypothetical protein ACF06D_13810 [Streptomyces griseoluteus]|uniref:hypothetical protein n=2 Tax=Streptomyces TaxID=1883 RepID=UPI0036FF7E9B